MGIRRVDISPFIWVIQCVSFEGEELIKIISSIQYKLDKKIYCIYFHTGLICYCNHG